MLKPQADRATLVAHLESHHPRVRIGHRTTAALSSDHATEHYRYTPASHHWHGPQRNRSASHRPDGWYTGTHVNELDEDT